MNQGNNDRARSIPSLDGLRAVSVALLLVAHAATTRGFPDLGRARWIPEKLGELGVKVFFVISGFLITSLLIRELETTGAISLRDFYLRRAFRIFPVYYFYLAVVFALSALGVFPQRPNDAFFSLTYLMNYHYDRSWNVGHAWSLSVEEQFYLLWPAVMCFAGPRRRVQIALAVVFIGPLARAVSWLLQRRLGLDTAGIGQTFPTVADALAIGCLLALERDRIASWQRYNALLCSPWFALAPLTAFVAMLGTYVIAFNHTIAQTIINVAICVTIDRCVRVPGGAVIRLLNSRPFVLVGTLSYSIYIWQQPFLNAGNTSPLLRFPLNVVLVLPVAFASYHLLEKPFLEIRARLQKRLARRAAGASEGAAQAAALRSAA
jgi:peptidoglycan/LPS O-acetylase OafA/YrhL